MVRGFEGHIHLSDFSGCMKLSQFGTVDALAVETAREIPINKLIYTAPEVAASESFGPAADLWSLGVVVHEMLHGTTPFEASPDKYACAPHLLAVFAVFDG